MPLAGSLSSTRSPLPSVRSCPSGSRWKGSNTSQNSVSIVFAAVTSDQRGMSARRAPMRCRRRRRACPMTDARRTKRSLPVRLACCWSSSCSRLCRPSTPTPRRRRPSNGIPPPHRLQALERRGERLETIDRADGTVSASIPSLRWGASRCCRSTKWAIPTIDPVSPTTRWTGRSLTTGRPSSSAIDRADRLSRPDLRASGRSVRAIPRGPALRAILERLTPLARQGGNPSECGCGGWSGWWRTYRSGCLPSITCLGASTSGNPASPWWV